MKAHQHCSQSFDRHGVLGRTLLFLILIALCSATLASVRPPTGAVGNINPPTPPTENIVVPNPGGELWRAVRQRPGDMPSDVRGVTQVGGSDSAVLISQRGEEFRQYRRNQFVVYSAWFMGAVLLAVALFYVARGKVMVDGGMSGRRIKRFGNFERVTHWFTASLFIFLAITGLILLFGRWVVLPLVGPSAYGAVASAAKLGHDLFGPLFIISILLLIVLWIGRNVPKWIDVIWFLKGGGLIGKGHASAGFFNAGEKVWYWSVVLIGIVVAASGLVLDFPIFGLGREMMSLALVVHGIAAVVLIGGSFGHIYIGTAGTEGSLDSMTTGYVDENWAKAHHDIWYKEYMGGNGEVVTGELPTEKSKDEWPPQGQPDRA
jgi:formate dehydrogenase subunit gamma